MYLKFGAQDVHHTLDGTDPILNDKGQSELQMGLLYLADAPWPIHQPGMQDVTRAQHEAQMDIVPVAVRNPVTGLYSETDSRRGGQISQAIGNVELDILQGREPVSTWNDAVEEWKRDGGDDIRDEFMVALEEVDNTE